MSEKLKPCPFCGEAAYLRVHVYGYGCDAFVQCHECTVCGPDGGNREGAIAKWNYRATPAAGGTNTNANPAGETFASAEAIADGRRKTGAHVMTGGGGAAPESRAPGVTPATSRHLSVTRLEEDTGEEPL